MGFGIMGGHPEDGDIVVGNLPGLWADWKAAVGEEMLDSNSDGQLVGGRGVEEVDKNTAPGCMVRNTQNSYTILFLISPAQHFLPT